MNASVELKPSAKTTSILLGYVIGTFKTDQFEGDVVASGKTLRVSVKGYSGFVDIEITQAVNKAVEFILANHEAKP